MIPKTISEVYYKGTNAFVRNESGLMELAQELTGFLVMVGLVMLPIGYAAISGLNKTALGITVGSTQDTILTSILTITLAVVVMALIGKVKAK
jgi:hypothetical protein